MYLMSPGLPFSNETVTSNHALDPTAALLPASIRTADTTLICPTDEIDNFLKKDLSVDKLNKIDRYLWLAGRPMPPKPLNYQIATSREILVDERIDMHLVWESTGRLHLKPIPRYLLDAQFWEKHLICEGSCCVAGQRDRVTRDAKTCTSQLYKCALGFLSSYIALIHFESDLSIAHTYRLLPHDVTWDKWLRLVQQVLKNGAANPQNINPRYLYGELRLSQLNKIYAFRHGRVLRGYQFTYQTYGELIRDYLTPLTAATIYVALVLTAMQVGLATNRLSDSLSFQNASYGFTVFAILGPLIAVVIVGIMGVFQFTNNLLGTRRFKLKQFAMYEQLRSRSQAA